MAASHPSRQALPEAQIVRFSNYLDLAGRKSVTTWPLFFAELRHRGEDPFDGDKQHPGWAPASFSRAFRRDQNVLSLSALVLDLEKRGTIADAVAAWGSWFGLLHTTRNHTVEAHRCRIVLPLARSVTPTEHARLWCWAQDRSEVAGLYLDVKTRNASRFWFMPGVSPGAIFEARDLEGDVLDPDPVLARLDRIEAQAAEARRAAPSPAPTPASGGGDRVKRARAYLAKMPGAYSGQGGHQATWEAALVLVRGFDLGTAAALDLLKHEYNPRCEPAWSERELRHKVESAERDGRVPMGYLLEDDRREWRTRAPRWQDVGAPISQAVTNGAGSARGYEEEERAALEAEGAPADEGPPAVGNGAGDAGAEEAEAEAPKAPASIFDKISVSDIFAPLPPVPWLVKKIDLCPGAPAMIAGYGFSKKTVAAQALALSIAAGRPVWGDFLCRRGKVLHLDYEQGRRLTLERYQRLARGMGIDPSELEGMLDVVVLPPLYFDAEGASYVLTKELEGYDLVIVDSFRAAAPSAEENSSDVRRHLDILTRAAEHTGTTSIVIHHARKTSREQAGDARQALRGSSGIYDACSSVLVFSAEKGQPSLVQHEKARTSGVLAEEFYLGVEDLEHEGDPRGALLVRTLSPEQTEKPGKAATQFDGLKEAIVRLVRDERELKSLNAICARVRGGNKGDKLEAIRELLAEGKLTQPGGEGTPYRAT